MVQRNKRLLSLLLVVALVCGLVCMAPLASAAYVYNPQPTTWGTFRDGLLKVCSPFATLLLPSSSWDFTFSRHGEVGDLSVLDGLCADYNSFIKRVYRWGTGVGGGSPVAYRAYDWDTMLTSFMANPVVPLFAGGGFEVLPGRDPDGPETAPRPSAEPFIDDDGSEVSIWDFPAKLFDSLWGLLTGLVGVAAGGFDSLFSLIGDGVGGFFGAFNGDDGVFGFSTYGGSDIWD